MYRYRGLRSPLRANRNLATFEATAQLTCGRFRISFRAGTIGHELQYRDVIRCSYGSPVQLETCQTANGRNSAEAGDGRSPRLGQQCFAWLSFRIESQETTAFLVGECELATQCDRSTMTAALVSGDPARFAAICALASGLVAAGDTLARHC